MFKLAFRIVFLFWLCLQSFFVKANTDSLLIALSQKQHDTTKASIYLELTRNVIYDNQILAKQYCLEGLALALKNDWRNYYVFYAHLATIYQLNNQHDSAIYYNKLNYTNALKANNPLNEAIALNNLASACMYANKLDEAYLYAEKAVAANALVNNKLGLAISRQIIGTIENDYGNPVKAITYLKQARTNFIEANDRLYAGSILITIADIYLNANKTDSALQYLNASKKEVGDLADAYFYESFYEQMGRYNMKIGKPYNALIQFNRASEYALQAGSTTHLVGLNLQKALAFFELKQLKKALAIAEPNIEPAIHGHLYDVANGCALLVSKIYEQQGQAAVALKYYKVHKQYSDSIMNTEKNKQLALLSVTYSSQQKEQENLFLQEVNLSKGKQLKLVIFIAILIIAFISVLALISNKNRNKTQLLNHKLQNLNQTKDRLFGIIAHDLRAPLTSTQMLSNLIGSKNLSLPEIHKYANELSLLTSKTNNLLDNTLNWAYSQTKGITISKKLLQLNVPYQECIELLAPQILKKNLSITSDITENTEAFLDEEIFKITLRNLLSNAIKYTPINGKIEVNWKLGNLSITDSGQGVPLEILNIINLPEALSPITSTKGTNNEKGTGLGLMLIKTLIKLHGGVLIAKNLHQGGACFTTSFN